jgi:hypothetical protein
MSCFHKKKIRIFKYQPVATFVFLGFHKNLVIISCSSYEDVSEYKMSLLHVDWCRFCIHLRIHLRSLNVSHCGMIEETRSCDVEVTFN